MTKRKARIEHSSGGVVARRVDESVHLLLIRDSYGKWGLPKGHVENGESSREAALREVREETGLTRLDPGPSLGTIDWYFRLKGDLVHKFCDYFLMVSPDGETRCAHRTRGGHHRRKGPHNSRTEGIETAL